MSNLMCCCGRDDDDIDIETGMALVTGGAQGIGRAVCEVLLSRGCKVCCLDVNSEKGKLTVEELQNTYGEKNCIFVECDVSSSKQYEEAYLRAKESFGNLNILINNAGIVECDKTVDVNLSGVIYGCKIAFKYMGKNNGGEGGVVVNVASVAGLQALAKAPVYSATKAGVISLTRSYGQNLHYEKSGIKFAAVCPAVVNTEIYQNVTKIMDIDEDIKEFLDRNLPMQPSRVAEAVIQLIEDGRNGAIMTVVKDKKNKYVKFSNEIFIK